MAVDEGGIRKIVQAMDDEILHVWTREVIREVWTRGLDSRRHSILSQTMLLSDEDLKHEGFTDETIRLIRLAEKMRQRN